jgi:type III restriction enzyme
VPYRYGSESRKYRPDFIVLVDDGHDPERTTARPTCCASSSRSRATAGRTPRRKAGTMRDYWVPGVNNLKTYGRWAFAEFCDVYEMQADFEAKVEAEFEKMINAVTAVTV